MDRFEQAARDNVERHIGDVCTGDDDPEVIKDEAYTLAFDGAVAAGAGHREAAEIATRIAEEGFGHA